MENLIDIYTLSHRSKARIKNLGEVFTPEYYVEEMLNLLAKDKKNLWSDEDIIFFEPCAGHGNIALAIYKRRLNALFEKAVSKGISDPAYFSIANALNTLWAIDIDKKNVQSCQTRILISTLSFLAQKTKVRNYQELLSKKKEYFAHIFSAIKWHIFVNETLSALSSNAKSAEINANLTKIGSKWFTQNGYHPINFNTTWVSFFKKCQDEDVVPLEYKRSLSFIENTLTGKTSDLSDFHFAKFIFEILKAKESIHKENYFFDIGA